MKRHLKIFFFAVLAWIILASIEMPAQQAGGELHFVIRSEPKTLHPYLVSDDSGGTVRYLTHGFLVRMNRQTQHLMPELAESWKVSNGGRTIAFKLRSGVKFSDATPFTPEDVAFSMKSLMDPALKSPIADHFRTGSRQVQTRVLDGNRIEITFPSAVAGLDRAFDQVAMLSAKSAKKEAAGLGPFIVEEQKPGVYLLLRRNPYYWKRDANGRALPYLSSVRLDIQQNRETEALRYTRGELHLINSLDAQFYERLESQRPNEISDAGVSLDTEQMWFNQVANAPIPAYKKAWFTSTNFRRAISEAINRADLARLAFRGKAAPANSPTSSANKLWHNTKLKAAPYDMRSALDRLQRDGFALQGTALKDKAGNAVEFSIITNAGNKPREQMAALIQQDLAKIGIKVNVVTLDFPSLIERMTQSYNYEAALLGLVNVDYDPNGQMNVWLSSSPTHQWNPSQPKPATEWEAEIDGLMQKQASAGDMKVRKQAWDRIQEIAYEQQPFIYLVNKNALAAISPKVKNAKPAILAPQTYWNIDEMWLEGK